MILMNKLHIEAEDYTCSKDSCKRSSQHEMDNVEAVVRDRQVSTDFHWNATGPAGKQTQLCKKTGKR